MALADIIHMAGQRAFVGKVRYQHATGSPPDID